MNWFKKNTYLSTLATVTVLVCAVSAFFAVKMGGQTQNALRAYTSDSRTLTELYSAPIYPTEEFADRKVEAVAAMERETANLASDLANRFEVPPGGEAATFGQRVRSEYDRLRDLWEEAGMNVPDNFFLGLEVYRTQISAREAAVDELDYFLGMVTGLLETCIQSGITSLVRLSRPDLRGELGGQAAVDERSEGDGSLQPLFHTYEVELEVVGPEDAVRALVNTIATSETHFMNIRALRLRNETQEGPSREEVRGRITAVPERRAGGGIFGGGIFGGGQAESGGVTFLDGTEEGGTGGEENGDDALPEPVFPEPGNRDAAEFLGRENVEATIRFELLIFNQAIGSPQRSGQDARDADPDA